MRVSLESQTGSSRHGIQALALQFPDARHVIQVRGRSARAQVEASCPQADAQDPPP